MATKVLGKIAVTTVERPPTFTYLNTVRAEVTIIPDTQITKVGRLETASDAKIEIDDSAHTIKFVVNALVLVLHLRP
jgi:hypothetical protein